MSGTLGYDPDALRGLRSAIVSLHDALAPLSSDDPAAQGPLAPVAGLRAGLDSWDRTIGSILSANLFTPLPSCAADDIVDGVLAGLAAQGWVLVPELPLLDLPEPSGSPPPVGVAEARAIGEALSPDQVGLLLQDDAGRTWLLQRLTVIDSDPTLRAAFVGALHDPAAILNALASLTTWRLQHPVLTSLPNACGVDRGERDLEQLIGFVAGAASGGDVKQLLSDPDLGPMAAAFVVRTSDLHGADLAEATATVLRRFQAERADGRWAPTLDGSVVPGDLVLPVVANDQVASRAFVHIALDDPDLLISSTYDAEAVKLIVLTATDRHTVAAAEAGEVITCLVRIGKADDPTLRPSIGPHIDLRTILGDVSSPWLDHFSASGSDDWPWGDQRPDLALRWMLGDPTSAAAIMNGLRGMIAAGAHSADGWRDLGDLITRVLVQARAVHVEAQLGGRVLVDLAIKVTGAVLSMIPGGKANVASVVAPTLLTWTADLASSHGWLPATDGTVRTQGWIDLDAQLARTVALSVGAAVHQLVADGKLSGDREQELADLIDHAAVQACPSTSTATGLRKFARSVDQELGSRTGVVCTAFTGMVAGLLPESSGELACGPHDGA
jgi:hypothetical protein